MEPRADDGCDLEQRFREGDEQALAALFSVHRARLWRMVQFRFDPRLSGRVDPDDVLQEAYLAARQRIDHYAQDGFTSPFIWLRLIVQQTLVDVHRRHLGAQARDAGREVPLSRPGNSPATSASLALGLVGDWTSPSQAAARGELFDTVRQAIETMDPVDQEILALRHFEELTNTETAAVLGIQQKAASIRYVRALRRLKTLLGQWPGLGDGIDHDRR